MTESSTTEVPCVTVPITKVEEWLTAAFEAGQRNPRQESIEIMWKLNNGRLWNPVMKVEVG